MATENAAVRGIGMAIRTGAEIGADLVRATQLPSVEGLTELELLALVNMLRAKWPFLTAGARTDDERDDVFTRVFSEDGNMRGAVALAKAVVHAIDEGVVKPAHAGGRMSLAGRAECGVVSDYHESALAAALRAGVVSDEDLVRLAGDGAALTERIERAAPDLLRASVPLAFQTFRDVMGTRADATRDEIVFDSVIDVEARGARFRARASNGFELWRIATVETKEPETIAWMEETLEGGGCLYDVGANQGLYAVFALARHPDVTVVAFEPDPVNYYRLCCNLRTSGFESRCVAYPVALGDATGVTQFDSMKFVAGVGLNQVVDASGAGGASAASRPAALRVGCALYRLDAFLEAAPGLARPTHLKIDVDGLDTRVLVGAEKTLARPELKHLIVEGMSPEIAAVTPLLESAGFRHVRSTQHGGAGAHSFGNHIFAKG